MQTESVSLTNNPLGVPATPAIFTFMRWAWKLAIVVAAMLALPATVKGVPLTSAIRQQGSLAFNFTSAANQVAQLAVAADGSKTIEVTDSDESAAMNVTITGRADEDEINLLVSSERDVTLTLGYASGASVGLSLASPPDGVTVAITVGAEGELTAAVIDPMYDRVGVSVILTGIESDSALTFVFDQLPSAEPASHDERVTPRYPGFLSDESLGGSVTLSAAGLATGSVYVVSLHYAAADAESLDESDLRVHRFENSTGAFEPIGTNDRGIGVASSGPGDYGVDIERRAAWGVVDQLGTFAVGVTDDTLPATVADDDLGSNGLGGTGRAVCGALGTLGLLPILLGLVALQRRQKVHNLG